MTVKNKGEKTIIDTHKTEKINHEYTHTMINAEEISSKRKKIIQWKFWSDKERMQKMIKAWININYLFLNVYSL